VSEWRGIRSPRLPLSAERLDQALLQLRDQGMIEQLLNDN